MYQKLNKFLEELHFVETIAELEKLLVPALDHYGIQHFLCTSMYGLPCLPDLKPMFGTWDSSWTKHYISNGYYREDAVPLHARGLSGQSLPFYWSDLMVQEELTKAQFRIFNAAWDAGLREGLVVPIEFDPKKELAMVSMAGRDFKKGDEAKGALWTIALQSHRRARHILMNDYNDTLIPNRIDRVLQPNIDALSPRQITMISWLAADNSPDDIARIEGISERSVHRHLSAARKTLGVDTNPGLVKVATQFRIIS